MEAYSRNVKDGEIGGLLLGKIKKNGDLVVNKAILLGQRKTTSHFEISEKAMMDFTKNASCKMLSSVIGWWHSHNTMNTFWSKDDDKCFQRLCNLSDMCFGIVVAFKGNIRKGGMSYKCRLDSKLKNGNYVSVDDIEPFLDVPIDFSKEVDVGKIYEEIEEKVEEDDRDWQECGCCGGTGFIVVETTKRKGLPFFGV